jgi:hypothetical protein
MLKVDSCL